MNQYRQNEHAIKLYLYLHCMMTKITDKEEKKYHPLAVREYKFDVVANKRLQAE